MFGSSLSSAPAHHTHLGLHKAGPMLHGLTCLLCVPFTWFPHGAVPFLIYSLAHKQGVRNSTGRVKK